MKIESTIEGWLGADNRIGIDIWNKKYRHGSESFDQWLDRVSGGNEDIKQLMIEKKFLYAGRILANRGLHKEGLNVTYSNCYVVSSPEDNIESIFDTAGKIARTFSYGGGVGIDLSKLAPRGATINNTAKETSGAVSFTDLYSMVTELIGQHGRRGALMLTMSCKHPDLEEFMSVKTDLERVTKANMSIRVTDKFMEAVRDRKTFVQQFLRPETGELITKDLDAHKFFMDLCKANWDYGEPACLFWDRVEDYSLMSKHPEYKVESTNPCGEEPLPAGGSCLLGSINLSAFVNDGVFDHEDFKETIRIAVRGLNEVLDEGLPLHPLEEQRNAVKEWRQIGLGIMGLADMLVKLKMEYGSDRSLMFCDDLARTLINTALIESSDLAREHGSFPKCDINLICESDFAKVVCNHGTREYIAERGLRNSQILTIAPTGSISTMLGISGGIEPIFANSYTRRTTSLSDAEETYHVYTPVIKEVMDELGVSENDLPDYCVTARDIDYRKRIYMQAVWQKYIDASISSTVNLPKTATVEDVYNLYMYAWEKGCKGITVFREGCQRDSILTTADQTAEPDPTTLVGKKRKLITGCGNLHCTAFFNPTDGDLVEVYLNKGSTGGCNNFMIGLSRMMSLSARNGVDVHHIVDQLKSCGSCPSYTVRKATQKDTSKGSSCPVAVGYALVDMWKDMQSDIGQSSEEKPVKSVNPCPVCDSELESQGGCMVCIACGWTRCD